LNLVEDFGDEDHLIDGVDLCVEVKFEGSSGTSFARIHFQRVDLKESKS
jgi:hypothetical protein